MIEIDKVELAKKIIGKENFIVLFFSKLCDVCETEKTILNYHLTNYYGICVDGDEDFFIKYYNLDLLPELRVYRYGDVVWSKTNIIQPDEIGVIKNHESHLAN